MRTPYAATLAATLLFGALTPLAASRAKQAQQVPVCPSPETAQQAAQRRGGATLPEGCRLIRIRRMETAGGPMCGVDLTSGDRGVGGAIPDATTTTEWWTVCANLRIQQRDGLRN